MVQKKNKKKDDKLPTIKYTKIKTDREIERDSTREIFIISIIEL